MNYQYWWVVSKLFSPLWWLKSINAYYSLGVDCFKILVFFVSSLKFVHIGTCFKISQQYMKTKLTFLGHFDLSNSNAYCKHHQQKSLITKCFHCSILFNEFDIMFNHSPFCFKRFCKLILIKTFLNPMPKWNYPLLNTCCKFLQNMKKIVVELFIFFWNKIISFLDFHHYNICIWLWHIVFWKRVAK